MRNRVITVGLAALAASLFWIQVHWPGSLTIDSFYQWEGARNGVSSDWHPPALSLVWRVLERFFPAQSGPFLLQQTLIGFGLAAHAFYLLRSAGTRSASLLGGAVLLLGFFPPLYSIAGAVLKDVHFCGALLAGTGAGLLGSQPERSSRSKALLLSLATLSFLYAGSVKHFGWIPALPLVFLCARKNGLRLSTSVGAAASPGLFALALSGAVVPSESYNGIRSVVYGFDLVGMSIQSQQWLVPEESLAPWPGKLDQASLRHAFEYRSAFILFDCERDPFNVPPICFKSFTWPETEAILAPAWRGAILERPFTYLKNRAVIFSWLFGVEGKQPWQPAIYGNAENPFKAKSLLDPLPFTPGRIHAALFGLVSPLVKTGFFTLVPYLILTLITLAAGLRFRNPIAVAFAASSFLQMGVLYFFIHGNDFRLFWWTIWASLLGMIYLFFPSTRITREK